MFIQKTDALEGLPSSIKKRCKAEVLSSSSSARFKLIKEITGHDASRGPLPHEANETLHNTLDSFVRKEVASHVRKEVSHYLTKQFGDVCATVPQKSVSSILCGIADPLDRLLYPSSKVTPMQDRCFENKDYVDAFVDVTAEQALAYVQSWSAFLKRDCSAPVNKGEWSVDMIAYTAESLCATTFFEVTDHFSLDALLHYCASLQTSPLTVLGEAFKRITSGPSVNHAAHLLLMGAGALQSASSAASRKTYDDSAGSSGLTVLPSLDLVESAPVLGWGSSWKDGSLPNLLTDQTPSPLTASVTQSAFALQVETLTDSVQQNAHLYPAVDALRLPDTHTASQPLAAGLTIFGHNSNTHSPSQMMMGFMTSNQVHSPGEAIDFGAVGSDIDTWQFKGKKGFVSQHGNVQLGEGVAFSPDLKPLRGAAMLKDQIERFTTQPDTFQQWRVENNFEDGAMAFADYNDFLIRAAGGKSKFFVPTSVRGPLPTKQDVLDSGARTMVMVERTWDMPYVDDYDANPEKYAGQAVVDAGNGQIIDHKGRRTVLMAQDAYYRRTDYAVKTSSNLRDVAKANFISGRSDAPAILLELDPQHDGPIAQSAPDAAQQVATEGFLAVMDAAEKIEREGMTLTNPLAVMVDYVTPELVARLNAARELGRRLGQLQQGSRQYNLVLADAEKANKSMPLPSIEVKDGKLPAAINSAYNFFTNAQADLKAFFHSIAAYGPPAVDINGPLLQSDYRSGTHASRRVKADKPTPTSLVPAQSTSKFLYTARFSNGQHVHFGSKRTGTMAQYAKRKGSAVAQREQMRRWKKEGRSVRHSLEAWVLWNTKGVREGFRLYKSRNCGGVVF